MINEIISDFQQWIESLGIGTETAQIIKVIILVAAVLLFALLVDFITKRVLLVTIKKVIRKSKSRWDDMLLRRRVIHRISHIAPALVVYYFIQIGLSDFPQTMALLETGVVIYMIFIIMLTLDAFFSALHDIYDTLPISKERPIKGYIQVAKILLYFIGGILIISKLIGKDPTAIFASLGALAAVLILVFRDTILGFVSSIQLSANQMVKPGDWISMPSREADGIVQEITVNTVKVRNWDKTISTIPTWALIHESFQNWKGMTEMQGRRISRSVFIDIKSIKFCDEQMLERFKRFRLIRDYINDKQNEIDEFNIAHGIDNDDTVGRRRLTNVGVFRKYIESYLNKLEKIHDDNPPYIVMVRHLQPTERGLPIQVYCFSKEYSWKPYEQVQADIFDHIFAVIPEFDLRVFQNPSGDDFKSLVSAFEGS
ncbi:MAG: mechanosensitive ion channel family protein [Bacteroidota bacterium]